MSKAVTIFLHGAAPGEIGRSRIVLEWPGHPWLLDFGTWSEARSARPCCWYD